MSGHDYKLMPIRDSLEHMEAPIQASLLNSDSFVSGNLPDDGVLELFPIMQNFYPTWFFIYLFVLLGFFAWIRLYYGNILTQTFQASTNFQVASRSFMDNSMLQRQIDNILYILYFFSIGFFLFIIEERLKLNPYKLEGGLLYLFNLALLLGLFFGRVVLMNLAGILFDRLKIFREYLYNAFIFNKLMGIFILPLLFFMVYTGGVLQMIFFWVALATAAAVIILKLLRGIVFSFKKDVSVFYMFLYLCALEIVPLVLLYRWFEGVL